MRDGAYVGLGTTAVVGWLESPYSSNRTFDNQGSLSESDHFMEEPGNPGFMAQDGIT